MHVFQGETFIQNSFNYIDSHASLLPAAYVDANWRFYRNTLNGVEEQIPLETRAVSFTSDWY